MNPAGASRRASGAVAESTSRVVGLVADPVVGDDRFLPFGGSRTEIVPTQCGNSPDLTAGGRRCRLCRRRECPCLQACSSSVGQSDLFPFPTPDRTWRSTRSASGSSENLELRRRHHTPRGSGSHPRLPGRSVRPGQRTAASPSRPRSTEGSYTATPGRRGRFESAREEGAPPILKPPTAALEAALDAGIRSGRPLRGRRCRALRITLTDDPGSGCHRRPPRGSSRIEPAAPLRARPFRAGLTQGGESSRGVGGGGAGGGGPPTGTVGTSGRSPARRASRSGSGLVEVVRDLSPPVERCRDALAPRRCGRGVQEDQRGPPALEGGVMTPAGAAALAALVDLPARPRVPASSGAAGPHDSPGAVRRAVLAGAVLVVLVGWGISFIVVPRLRPP